MLLCAIRSRPHEARSSAAFASKRKHATQASGPLIGAALLARGGRAARTQVTAVANHRKTQPLRFFTAGLTTSSNSPYGRMIMNWGWTKWPPIMQRTLADDLKWALFVLTGATLGYLVFGGGDTSLLLGCVIGAVLVIVVLNVLRRVRRRRSA